MATMTPESIVATITAAAADKKARDTVVLDVRGKSSLADYFVICEGDTDRQVRAIVENVTDQCALRDVEPVSVTGQRDASWACVDLDSVIVHVFLPGERTYYDLEGLWSEAPLQESLGQSVQLG